MGRSRPPEPAGPSWPPEPAGSPHRLASILDTALLVFLVLLVLAAGWWVLKVVVGTVLFFAKLAILALLFAVTIRFYLWVRRRLR